MDEKEESLLIFKMITQINRVALAIEDHNNMYREVNHLSSNKFDVVNVPLPPKNKPKPKTKEMYK